MKKALIWILAGIGIALAAFIAGRRSVQPPKPSVTIITDTVTITEVRVDTVTRWKTKTAYLPRVDTVTLEVRDTVQVEVPISRYVAADTLYHVVATGYEVEFEEISIYPRTVIKEHYIECGKAVRWGLGVQAGYGAAISGSTVRLSPYIGIGISWNLLTL